MKKIFNVTYDYDGGSSTIVVAVKYSRDFATMFNDMLKEFNESMNERGHKLYKITSIEYLNITMYTMY